MAARRTLRPLHIVSGFAALVMLVPATLLMQYGVILREERYLEGLFGDEYLSYKRATRRWV